MEKYWKSITTTSMKNRYQWDLYQEFKMFNTRDANGNEIPIESNSGVFESHEGIIRVPLGSGLGVNVDPNYLDSHNVFRG